jgi:hypothetical protein
MCLGLACMADPVHAAALGCLLALDPCVPLKTPLCYGFSDSNIFEMTPGIICAVRVRRPADGQHLAARAS